MADMRKDVRKDIRKVMGDMGYMKRDAVTERTASDNVNHPSHYCEGRTIEPIEVIDDWGLGFNLGNVIKYVSRAGRKDDRVTDLQKAMFYLSRELTKAVRDEARDEVDREARE